MSNERFWKIVDKFERIQQSNICIVDDEQALCNIAYYDQGKFLLALSDALLLYRDNVSDELKDMLQVKCNEYNILGAKAFKKLYQKAFTN